MKDSDDEASVPSAVLDALGPPQHRPSKAERDRLRDLRDYYWEQLQEEAKKDREQHPCTGECQQPPPDNKVLELAPTVFVTTGSVELAPLYHSLRFIDPLKGDSCLKGRPLGSERCEVCDCAVCRYCGQPLQVG